MKDNYIIVSMSIYFFSKRMLCLVNYIIILKLVSIKYKTPKSSVKKRVKTT